MDGKTGGHCILNNIPLLGHNQVTDFIQEYNDTL
jgi:hypothetical protein